MINKKGFTLIELLVAVLIVGVLTAIALPQYNRSVERTRVAEALTLMRSIYDSCERLAWENNKDSCAAGIKDGVVNMKKLDIIVKGTYDGDNAINTGNFKYTLGYKSSTFGVWTTITTQISAVPQKGKYAEKPLSSHATITFNGNVFSCENPTNMLAGSDMPCTVWGASSWNK